jgi:predicted dehydrogenase
MAKSINAGIIIGCINSHEFVRSSSMYNQVENYNWKKIWVSDSTNFNGYREHTSAEIVSKVEAIINDKDIALVFVSAQHLDLVKPVIQAGKSVRII